ncbi:MAG TPA: D-glycero-beta-D-manno-heptose-7-phosphate kinase [Ignavibacteria bacterium]|nr:D-glycero-beta-D-manno-heptose-7-phosphate kinase [Ignavibacteria bacterium]
MTTNISISKVKGYFKHSQNKKIAVIGDVMLDKYVYGDVNRISPEAPVQVIDIKSTAYRLGGAANVANNVKTLEAEPVLIGIIGDDEDGKKYIDTMKKAGLLTTGIIVDKSRPTTAKTRVIAHSQHIVRLDSEHKMELNSSTEKKLLKFFKDNINNFAAVILQDYNKGVLTEEVISSIIEISRKANKPVYVDPKYDNFFNYQNVTVFKPNRKEVQDVIGKKVDGDDDARKIGRELIDRLNCEYLVLTRGEKGMMLFDKEKDKTVVLNVPTKALNVADVSGAGDTVISTIAVMLSGGASIIEAVILANHAAGIVCEEVGIVPIYKKALIESFY